MNDEVSRQTHEALSAQLHSLGREVELQRRFLKVILDGNGLQQIIDALAQEIAGSVFFDDNAHQLIAYSGAANEQDPRVIEEWENHSRQPHGAKGAIDCVWQSVEVRDEQWGRIHAFASATNPADFVENATKHAAEAATLWLLTRREPTSLIDETRSALIADLWQGRQWSSDRLIARSRSLGGNLDRPVLVGVAIQIGNSEGETSQNPRLQQLALELLQQTSQRFRIDSFSAVVDGTTVGILGLQKEQHSGGALSNVLDETLDQLTNHVDSSVTVSIGVSQPGAAERLRRMITTAADAASHGLRVEGRSGCYYSEELGLRNLLTLLSQSPQLSQFVEEQIGPLIAYDATARTPLIDTLRSYLDHSGHKAKTADALHVERRTLYYRLARIEDVLMVSLDDAAAKLRLHVALQSFDVIRSAAV